MPKQYAFTTQPQIREAFWLRVPATWRKRNSYGDYYTDCRCEFVDFVDMLQKDGHISEALASRVTL